MNNRPYSAHSARSKACYCFKCNWATSLMLLCCIVGSTLLVCFLQIPSIHRVVFHDSPIHDGDRVFSSAASAVRSIYQRVPVEALIVPPNYALATRYRYVDSVLQGFVPSNPEMTDPVSVLDTNGLIWITWDQSRSKVSVCFFGRECFPRSTIPIRIDTTSQDPLILDSIYEDVFSDSYVRKQGVNYFSVPFPLTRDTVVNRASLEKLLATFMHWTSSPDEDSIARAISLDTLTARANRELHRELDQHLQTLWRSTRYLFPSLVGIAGLIFSCFYVWYNRTVWRTWLSSIIRAYWLRYMHHIEFKRRLPLGWRQFYRYLRQTTIHDFGLYYEHAMYPFLQEHQRERLRNQRSESAHEQYQLLHQMNLEYVRTKCGGVVPPRIRRMFNRQFDASLNIFIRLDIARQCFAALKDEHRHVISAQGSATTELAERILWDRINAVDGTIASKELCKQFNDLVRHAEREAKQSKRMYYLRKALTLVDKKTVDSASGEHMPTLSIPTGPTVTPYYPKSIEDLPILLGISDLIPSGIDAPHVEWIIISLARPTRSTPKVNEGYTQGENLRKDVSRKMKSFDMVLYDQALVWLQRNGVVYRFKQSRHEKYYSLNPHPFQATVTGRPIVKKVLEFLNLSRTGWHKAS